MCRRLRLRRGKPKPPVYALITEQRLRPEELDNLGMMFKEAIEQGKHMVLTGGMKVQEIRR